MAPSSSSSLSKKLLISDPKYKSATISSSSTNSPPPQIQGKRTRDQPNFSDCHCCGRRIIHSNPKDRLQPLDSFWRIVLLCRKCRTSICSGQTCPYCFQIMGKSDDFCTCIVCQRKIHKGCVRDYGKCTPWCYLGGWIEGFKVCVDCWVPELLKNSVQDLEAGENRGVLKEKCDGNDLLENVVHNVKYDVNMKVKKVTTVKDRVLKMNKRTIGRVDLADGGFDLFSKNDRDNLNSENLTCSGETEVVDNADLAIQLHRAVNSSPITLRGHSLGNSNGLDSGNVRIWKGLFYERSGSGKRRSEDRKVEVFTDKVGVCTDSAEIGRVTRTVENDSSIDFSGLSRRLIAYKRDTKRKIWPLDNENFHSGVDGRRYEQELICYKRTNFKKKICQLNGVVSESGNGSSCGNHRVPFRSDFANHSKRSLVKNNAKGNFLRGSSDREHDRFHLKYVKRLKGTKTCSSFLQDDTSLSDIQVPAPVKSCSDGFSANGCESILPNGTCAPVTDRYSLKYSKRVKSLNIQSNMEAEVHSYASVDKVDISAT